MDRLRSRLAYLEEELASKTRAPRVNPASDESDIIKANEIIRRLQDELKGARTRIRATESSLRQIELVGKETQASYDSLRAELVECRASLSQKTRLLSETETERDKLKTEVEDTRKLVTANEKVIQWLHERMAVDPNNASFGATDSFSRRGLRGKDYDPDFKMNDNIFPREYPIPPPSSPSSSSTSPPVF